MRLTGLSWFRGLPPHWAQLTALAPLGIATLLTTIPSTTYSGSTLPMMVETPRRLSWMPPPGAPELAWISAPGILPWSALSSVWVGRARQLARADGRHRVGQVLLLDAGRLAGDDDLLELEHVGLERHVHRRLARMARATSCRLNPMALHRERGVPVGRFITNRPSLPAWATIWVPADGDRRLRDALLG